MPNTYSIKMLDAFGAFAAELDDFIALDAARVVNDVGAISLELPPRYTAMFADETRYIDSRIAIYRSINGGLPALWGDTVFLIRKVTRKLSNGVRSIVVRAYDANHLLTRRIVAYNATSAQASQSDQADDMMKAIMRQNYGATATDTARDISAYLAVQADFALGQTISKAFSRRIILNVLQELAQTSAVKGTYLAFDVVAPTEATLEFRTYATYRGVDHSSDSGQPVIIGPEYGNASEPELDVDSSEEKTYVYAGGQGEDAARIIATASDTARIATSPLNRCELFADARLTLDPTKLTDEAQAALRLARPRRSFRCQFQDTPGTTFGLHFNFGDIVTASFDGTTIDCRIDAMGLTLKDGRETVNIQLRSEDLTSQGGE